MLRLMAPRIIAADTARRAQLGLDDAVIDQARRLVVKSLAGGGPAARARLLATLEAAGLSTGAGRGYHLLAHLARSGIICLGPLSSGGEQSFALVDEWIEQPRHLEREEALGLLALRYFRSHGPATVKDFMRWTNLVAVDARAGLAVARPELTRVEVGQVEYFMDPRTPDLLDAHRRRATGVFLLPGFDEFILGYGDRSAVLPAEFADQTVPGGNGVFRPTVISAGQVVGTWKHTGRAKLARSLEAARPGPGGVGAERTVQATPFTSFTASVEKAISRAYGRLP